MNTYTKYIGEYGVCYGVTPNGEFFSYSPKDNGSFYHCTIEAAEESAMKINASIEKMEDMGRKAFDLLISMD